MKNRLELMQEYEDRFGDTFTNIFMDDKTVRENVEESLKTGKKYEENLPKDVWV